MSVLVVGSANLDLIVKVPELPRPGQTVLGSDVRVRPGGKGANQAVAAARLGAEVTLVAATGTDEFSSTLHSFLAGAGPDIDRVQQIDGPTGVALIVVDPAAENAITVASGANRRLTPDRLPPLEEVIGVDTVLLTQLEIPVETCLAAAAVVQAAGGRVVVNSAPLTDASDPVLARLLQHADVLVANQVEALALVEHRLGRDGLVDISRELWCELARGLLDLGPSAVIVTLGAEGAVVAQAEGSTAIAASQVAAVDSTGAGDAFCGALVAALDRGATLHTAAELACRAGAIATTAVGAQESLPSAAELRWPVDPAGRLEVGAPVEEARRA